MSSYKEIFCKYNNIPYGNCLELYDFDNVIEFEMQYHEEYQLCHSITMQLSREELETLASNILSHLNKSEEWDYEI